MKPWVVIPAYHEAPMVGVVVRSVQPYAERVVVVDDGSPDATGSEARGAGATVLTHPINRGYGAALVTGTAYAFQQGAAVVVHFDADGQFEAADIPKLTAAVRLGEPSLALGSRFLGRTENMPFIRQLTLKLAILFTWAVSGIKLTDAHNGFRAITRATWAQMRCRQDLMAFSSEVIDEAARLHITPVEVPVTVRYTAYSRAGSKQGRFPVLKIVRDIFIGRIVR